MVPYYKLAYKRKLKKIQVNNIKFRKRFKLQFLTSFLFLENCLF